MVASDGGVAGERCPGCGGVLVEGCPCPACVAGVLLGDEGDEGEAWDAGEGGDFSGAAGEVLAGTEIAGIELGEVIGRGGMGVVLRGVQASPRREVAVKVLGGNGALISDEMRGRFRQEIEVAGRLRHPGIVPVYESGLANGGRVFYYVMELVDGVPLREFVGGAGMGLDGKLGLFEKLCEAVEYAHRRGVIHRDLSPANVLVGPGGEPRLLDFGLAKVLGLEGGGEGLSLAGGVVGSPCTMSPEQAAGAGEVDTRSDVYSLGALLHFLLAGDWAQPQEGSVVDVLYRIAHEPVVVAERGEIDRGLRAVLEKAMALAVEDRYGSVGELLADVRRYRRREELSVRPLGWAGRLWLWGRRRPVVAALWVVSGLLVVGAGVGGVVVAKQEARVRAAVEAREEAQRRGLVELLLGVAAGDLLEVYRLVGGEGLGDAVGLLRAEYAREGLSLEARARLCGLLHAAEGGRAEEVAGWMRGSPDVDLARFLAAVLEPEKEGHVAALRERVGLEDDGVLSDELNCYVALAAWEPEDAGFWEARGERVVELMLRLAVKRGEAAGNARAFAGVRGFLVPVLEREAGAGRHAARQMLALMVEAEVRALVDAVLASDRVFVERFPEVEARRVEVLSVLTELIRREVRWLRGVPAGDGVWERLGRAAVAVVRLDRENQVWRHLGYRWALREVMIEKLVALEAGVDLLHWKLRRTNGDSLPEEGMRTAIARCFLQMDPAGIEPTVRENLLERQRAVLERGVLGEEGEPLEVARALLAAWE